MHEEALHIVRRDHRKLHGGVEDFWNGLEFLECSLAFFRAELVRQEARVLPPMCGIKSLPQTIKLLDIRIEKCRGRITNRREEQFYILLRIY